MVKTSDMRQWHTSILQGWNDPILYDSEGNITSKNWKSGLSGYKNTIQSSSLQNLNSNDHVVLKIGFIGNLNDTTWWKLYKSGFKNST
jgi:hypothetical protein